MAASTGLFRLAGVLLILAAAAVLWRCSAAMAARRPVLVGAVSSAWPSSPCRLSIVSLLLGIVAGVVVVFGPAGVPGQPAPSPA